jgi:translation initiation factor eIF-2B subunit gamma
VVVPCDFIPPPSLPLSHLLNKFRVDALSDNSLATTCWYSSQPPEKGSFPEEWGPLPATLPIVWDPSSSTLLHIETPDDVDRNADEIELKMSMLSRSVCICPLTFNLDLDGRYPHTRLSMSFEDSHVYVFRRSVLDLLHQKPHFSSLKEEFLPWLCKFQYRHSKRLKYMRGSSLNSNHTLRLWYIDHPQS